MSKSTSLQLQKQHISARVYSNYVLYLQKHYPKIDVEELVEQCGLQFSDIQSRSAWVSASFGLKFTRLVRERTGDPDLEFNVGLWSVTKEGLPAPIFMAAKTVSSVYYLYRLMILKSFPSVNKVVNLRILHEADGLLEIEVAPLLAGLDEEDASALMENFPNVLRSMVGYFSGFPQLLNMPAAKIETTLAHDASGTPYCRMRVSYINHNAFTVTLLYLSSIALGITSFCSLGSTLPFILNLPLACLWFLLAVIWRTHERLKTLQSIAAEAQKSYDDVQSQYSETHSARIALDRSLAELDLINMLLRTLIQARTSADVIHNGCRFLVEKFGFDRVVVFQINETKDKLFYQFGSAADPALLNFFSSLTLPAIIDSTDPTKLSNVYRFRKSLLIEDCGAHLNRLSEEGRQFLLASQSQSFIAVPIVANDTCFGIFVIDAFYKRRRLTQTDLALAEKVANAVAAALEKNELQAAREEALERSNKFKDQILANTSHELRTPINGIVNFARIVRESAQSQLCESDKQFLESIEQAGNRLSRLVNNILEQAVQNYGNLELRTEPVSLYALVCNVVAELEIANDRKQVRINIDNQMNPLWVSADKDKLFQVLLNLLQNALKFTVQGSITISAKTRGSEVEVYVTDTGPGIAEVDRERIFEPFVKAETHGKQQGVGLGLAITKGLVHRMGGRIWVESPETHAGSRLCFSLPEAQNVPAELVAQIQIQLAAQNTLQNVRESRSKRSASERVLVQLNQPPSTLSAGALRSLETEAAKSPEHAMKQETTILIVDDEPINVSILSHFLQSANFKIISAADGNSALEIVKEGPAPDLVLLDIMMPVLNGYEVCEILRKTHSAMALPIIMMSAKHEVDDVLKGFSCGANDYVGKPFVKEILLARVVSHLGVSYVSRVASRFVPWELVRLLGAKDLTEVQVGKGAEFEIAVFYLDLRKFTELLEAMACSDAFAFLNSFLGHVVPLIIKHRGIVDKYIGDCVMGVFLSADDALAAAVEVQNSMKAYNLRHRSGGKRRFVNAGIGVHWGKAFVGSVGISRRLDVTVVSDAVNTGSRLQELTKTYGAEIVISEAIAKLASPAMAARFRYIDDVLIRGRKEKVRVYSVDTEQSNEYAASTLQFAS